MKTAERFATVVDGKVVLLTEATPEHELLPNQISISWIEWQLLKNFDNFAVLRLSIDHLEKRIKAVK